MAVPPCLETRFGFDDRYEMVGAMTGTDPGVGDVCADLFSGVMDMSLELRLRGFLWEGIAIERGSVPPLNIFVKFTRVWSEGNPPPPPPPFPLPLRLPETVLDLGPVGVVRRGSGIVEVLAVSWDSAGALAGAGTGIGALTDKQGFISTLPPLTAA